MLRTSCTYIGHATVLIRIGDATILTDPHFGSRTLIFPRQAPLPFPPSELPDPSAVLLTHTHFDHLNIASYKYISCGVPIICPEGSERAIGQYVPNPIIELSHHAEHELTCGVKIVALPARHHSSRLSHLRFTRTNAYLIRREEAGSAYFCGDSAYGSHFLEAGSLDEVALAFLPISSYRPRWFFGNSHMTPAEAVRAFEDLKALHMLPIHHGTFRLSLEALDDPLKRLTAIIAERPDLASKIHPLRPGEEFCVP